MTESLAELSLPIMTNIPKDKKPFEGRCLNCEHVWIIAYTPMEMRRFARVVKLAHCPMCGFGSKNIVLPANRKGEDHE